MGSASFQERLAQVRALMHVQGLDFVLAGPSADMVYLTGAHIRPSERLALFILPQEGPPHFLLPGFEASSLPPLPEGTQLKTWGESDNPTQIAAQIIARGLRSEPGGVNCTIGVAERLWSVYLLRLQAALPRAAFTTATAVLSGARQIKTADEIERLKKAGARADDAYREVITRPFIGRSEIEVSNEFAKILESHGLTMADPPLVGSGPNSASPHQDTYYNS